MGKLGCGKNRDLNRLVSRGAESRMCKTPLFYVESHPESM